MATIPLWRKRVTVQHYSEFREELGIWVCGSHDVDEALPASIKARLGDHAGYYSLLTQRIYNGYVPLGQACLYTNPTTGVRKLLVTDVEFMCDDVSDLRMLCSSTLEGCENDVAILCRKVWLEKFRRLEAKGLISPATAEQICDIPARGLRPY